MVDQCQSLGNNFYKILSTENPSEAYTRLLTDTQYSFLLSPVLLIKI